MGVSRSGYYKWKKREPSVRDLNRENMIASVKAVYSSMAYNELIRDTNIVRSMSRAGKPTDNPVNEALNGWIKEELFVDFKIEQCRSRDEFRAAIERYAKYYNEQRPCYAVGYDTPANYRKRYYRGELERKTPSHLVFLLKNPSSSKSEVNGHILSLCPLLKKKILEKYLVCLLL